MTRSPSPQHKLRSIDDGSLPGKRRRPSGNGKQQYLEIRIGSGRKWAGLIGYAMFFLAVCGVLVMLFVRFTSSLRLAVGLVAFLVSYMLLMGWWASKNVEDRDR
jgi:hypothetical protein